MPERVGITFGVLFDTYADISDTLVGILMRARKRKKVSYDGDGMLFQGVHDHVVIRLCPAAPESETVVVDGGVVSAPL